MFEQCGSACVLECVERLLLLLFPQSPVSIYRKNYCVVIVVLIVKSEGKFVLSLSPELEILEVR